jgi:nitrite reductase/ring-hydroxylating ferredoxin subunit
LALDGTKLTCPKHQWEFDATSGSCIKKGNSPLTRFESKVVKGRLMAFW